MSLVKKVCVMGVLLGIGGPSLTNLNMDDLNVDKVSLSDILGRSDKSTLSKKVSNEPSDCSLLALGVVGISGAIVGGVSVVVGGVVPAMIQALFRESVEIEQERQLIACKSNVETLKEKFAHCAKEYKQCEALLTFKEDAFETLQFELSSCKSNSKGLSYMQQMLQDYFPYVVGATAIVLIVVVPICIYYNRMMHREVVKQTTANRTVTLEKEDWIRQLQEASGIISELRSSEERAQQALVAETRLNTTLARENEKQNKALVVQTRENENLIRQLQEERSDRRQSEERAQQIIAQQDSTISAKEMESLQAELDTNIKLLNSDIQYINACKKTLQEQNSKLKKIEATINDIVFVSKIEPRPELDILAQKAHLEAELVRIRMVNTKMQGIKKSLEDSIKENELEITSKKADRASKKNRTNVHLTQDNMAAQGQVPRSDNDIANRTDSGSDSFASSDWDSPPCLSEPSTSFPTPRVSVAQAAIVPSADNDARHAAITRNAPAPDPASNNSNGSSNGGGKMPDECVSPILPNLEAAAAAANVVAQTANNNAITVAAAVPVNAQPADNHSRDYSSMTRAADAAYVANIERVRAAWLERVIDTRNSFTDMLLPTELANVASEMGQGASLDTALRASVIDAKYTNIQTMFKPS